MPKVERGRPSVAGGTRDFAWWWEHVVLCVLPALVETELAVARVAWAELRTPAGLGAEQREQQESPTVVHRVEQEQAM